MIDRMNDNAPESDFFAESAKKGVHAENAYTSSDLWLPVSARAQHDEPISVEVWERRERARREAEAVIAKAFQREA